MVGPCPEGSKDPACTGLHDARDLENGTPPNNGPVHCSVEGGAHTCGASADIDDTITDSEGLGKITTRATEEACPLDVVGNPDSGCNGAIPILGHTGGQPVIPNVKVLLHSL